MILILISVVIAVVGFICFKKGAWGGAVECSGKLMTIFGCSMFVSFLFFSGLIHIMSGSLIQEYKAEYEPLMDKIQTIESFETECGIDASNLVAADIAEWNQKVKEYKEAASNPWINCFFDQDVADALQYIEVPDVLNQQ